MNFAEMNAPTLIVLALVVGITTILLLRASRYFSRPKSSDPSWSSVGRTPNDLRAAGRSLDIPPEMSNWEVEMHDFVREIQGELDSKMRALQAVTAEADRAAARLEAAIRNSTGGGFSSEIGDAGAKVFSATPASVERQEAGSPDITQSILSFHEGTSKSKPGIDLSSLPGSQADSLSPLGVPHAEHSSAQAKKEEIYTLADYGMAPSEIASRVGHPPGEVELILNLRAKK
jgi:hypothetical protein